MKNYGIRMTLPDGDTLRGSHLLGEDFETYRWYLSESERDNAFIDMQKHLPNYRPDDYVTQVLEKVEKN